MKEFLKPCAYKPSEPRPCRWVGVVTACLLKNEPASQWRVARLTGGRVAVAKASPIRAVESRVLDPKRGDLAMGRVKRR